MDKPATHILLMASCRNRISIQPCALQSIGAAVMYLRYEKEWFFLDVNEIAEKERPPMVEVKEYLEGNKTF